MFSIIRSFTSLYWVIRDIFRPLFRTTFFWLVLLALGVWFVLSGSTGAILLNDLSVNNSVYSNGSYPNVLTNLSDYNIPSGSEYISQGFGSVYPIFKKNHVGRYEIFFPYEKTIGGGLGSLSITNNQGFFSFLFKNKVSNFTEISTDRSFGYTLLNGTNYEFNGHVYNQIHFYNKNNLAGQIINDVRLFEQAFFIFGNSVFLFSEHNSELYQRDFVEGSTILQTFTRTNFLPYLKINTPNKKYTNIEGIQFSTDYGRRSRFYNQCTPDTIATVNLEGTNPDYASIALCLNGSFSSSVPTAPIDLDSYLNVIIPDIDPDTLSSYTGSAVNSWTTTSTSGDIRTQNISSCIDMSQTVVTNDDLNVDIVSCVVESKKNVLSGGSDVAYNVMMRFDDIYTLTGTDIYSPIQWNDFDIITGNNSVSLCKDVVDRAYAIKNANIVDNWRSLTNTRIAFGAVSALFDKWYGKYNIDNTYNPSYGLDRSYDYCSNTVDMITNDKNGSTGTGTTLGDLLNPFISSIKSETPSLIDSVGAFLQNIRSGLGKIYEAITGTNTALDGVKNAINEKNMSFTGYTDIINNITGISVDVPDVVVDIPDINIDLGYSQGTSTGGIFSFLNQYITISTEYVFVPNMCKNTTPTNYDNRKNLIMLFMVTITTMSFYFVIIRR